MSFIDLDAIVNKAPVCLNPAVGAEVTRLREMSAEFRTQSLVLTSPFMRATLKQAAREYQNKADEYQATHCKGRLLNGNRVCDCSAGESRQSGLTVQPSQHES
jgi:hypothetical protein